MSKSYQKGGQRRTIETGCGWRCVGHPTEVNKKYILHKKYCKDCGDNNTDKLPEWNKEGGLMNGWKGITNRNQQPNQMLTTAFVDGVRQDIHLKDVNSMEDAMNDAKLLLALLAEENITGQIPTPLSKSQKKRQKQKAKKLSTDDKNELLAKEIYSKVPSEKLDKFLDKFENSKEDGGLELAELAGEYMTLEELDAIIKMLNK